MRVRLALFLVSSLLFVTGVGMTVAAARVMRRPTPVQTPLLTPVGSVRHIMRGVVDPAATVVFGAVSTTVTKSGTEEKAPATQEEWDRVADSAAAVAEAGNLLLVGSRVVDHDDWTAISLRMVEAGRKAFEAAQAKDASAVFASGEAIYETCDTCHSKYRRTQ